MLGLLTNTHVSFSSVNTVEMGYFSPVVSESAVCFTLFRNILELLPSDCFVINFFTRQDAYHVLFVPWKKIQTGNDLSIMTEFIIITDSLTLP